MSKYRTIEVDFTNEDALIQALTDVCRAHDGEPVLSHANDVPLYGYRGKQRDERAKYVVRRAQIGNAANDLGFAQRADGSFEVLISEFDSSAERSGFGLHILNEVKARYNYHNVQALAWQQGYTVFESLNDAGETVLQLQRAY